MIDAEQPVDLSPLATLTKHVQGLRRVCFHDNALFDCPECRPKLVELGLVVASPK
jgi:hypothetical protein